MVFKEYTFELDIDDNPFDPSPEDINFSIRDNLFSFFSYGSFSIDDHSSIFLEYRLLNDGIPISIGFGTIDDDTVPKTQFIVDHCNTNGSTKFGILTTIPEVELVHREITNLGVLSRAVSGTTSEVVEKTLESFGFEEIIISASSGSGIWYRPMQNEQEFIENILLQRSMSSSNEFSPFFAFTTSDNIFHFEDLASLQNKSVKQEFIFRPSNEYTMDPTFISTIIPFTNGYRSSKPSWNRITSSLTRQDFTQVDLTRTLPERFKKQPLLYGEIGNITDFVYDGFFIADDTLDESRKKGYENFLSRKAFFQESFIITTMQPYTNLHAGDKIKITVTTSDESGYADSLYFSGEYIIESSNHEWAGKEEKGFSEFVISRGSATLPSDHLITEKFVQ